MIYPPVPSGYIKDCHDRVLNSDKAIEAYLAGTPLPKDENEKVKPMLCMRITQVVQHTVGTSPQLCAICMLRGEPSQELIDNKVAGFLMSLLDMAHKGWYGNEDTVTVLKKTYPYVKRNGKHLQKFVELMAGCVELKRISLEQAEELVKTDMRELLDEHFGKTALGGGEARAGCGKLPNSPA